MSYAYYRAVVFICMYLGYSLYVYDRKSFSFAMPALINEGLTKSELGSVVSSQLTAYSVSKFLAGIVSDKIRPNLFFAAGLAIAGVSNIAFLWVHNAYLYCILWFVNGIAQGAGWPSCARILRHWVSSEQFGTYWAILSTSMNVAGMLGPLLSAYILQYYPWRFSLLLPGILSIVMSAFCLICLHSQPEDVGLVSLAPKSGNTDGKRANRHDDATFFTLLSSPFTLVLFLGYLSVFAIRTAVTEWGQLYLINQLNHDTLVGSSFISSVETGGLMSCIIAGFVGDWLVKLSNKSVERHHQPGARRNARMPAIYSFMIGSVLGLYVFCFYVSSASSQLTLSIIGIWLGICLYGPIAIFGVVAVECCPNHLSGSGHAIAALGANVGGVAAGLPFSILAKHYNWSAVFVASLTMNIAALIYMLAMRNTNAYMIPERLQVNDRNEHMD